MSTSIRQGKLIYHQTKLDNLESIVKYGLKSRINLKQENVEFQDVADSQILEGRSKNGLDNYVPFHFHPRTAFDYKIRSNNPNSPFIFLCMYRDIAAKNGAIILPAHPLSNIKPQVYPYNEGINIIDWDTMDKNQNDVGYNSNVRMAECLLKDEVKIQLISMIFANNENDKNKVHDILDKYKIHNIKVIINSTFF